MIAKRIFCACIFYLVVTTLMGYVCVYKWVASLVLLLLLLCGEKGFPVIIKYFVIGHVTIMKSVHSLTYFPLKHMLVP